MSDLAIDLSDVTKTYRGGVHALRGVSMRVGRGEVFGLLGPNGAGKSTLVKIMMTVVRPTAAAGTLLGRPIGHKPTLARVGYLPENHRFPRYLTGRQVLRFFAALADVPRAAAARRADELLEIVGMSDWASDRIGSYSKGMLQRLGLAQAMVNDPDLIVLDEPTDGVDPTGRRDIRAVLLNLRSRGTTIFLNSHLLSELEALCDRVAILAHGRVARAGAIDELTRADQFYLFEVGGAADVRGAVRAALPGAFADGVAVAAGAAGPPPLPGARAGGGEMRGTLALNGGGGGGGALPGGVWCAFDGATLRVGTTDADAVQSVLDGLRRANLTVRRMQPVRPSLEDLFMEAVTDPTTGATAKPGAQR